jgi:integrase
MLYKRPDSNTYWTRFTTPGHRRIRRSTGTEDKKAAEEYEARLKGEYFRQERLGERPSHTWEEAVVRWLRETEHKASQYDDINLLRWLDPHLAGVRLEEIDADRVEAIAQARKVTGVKNATLNRMLALIRAILRRAERQWRWIDRAPSLRFFAVQESRVRWLTREEAARLLAELPEHLASMAEFTLATGLRAANVTGLEWSQIDLARRVAWVHPDQAKARKAIGVPLNTTAVLVLRRWQGRHHARVFCYQRQRGGACTWEPVQEANSAAWYKALKRAGIEDFRWHDLRHTWASWHVQAGTPLHELQQLGGWASYDMVLKYAHMAPEHLAEAASRIDVGLCPVGERGAISEAI